MPRAFAMAVQRLRKRIGANSSGAASPRRATAARTARDARRASACPPGRAGALAVWRLHPVAQGLGCEKGRSSAVAAPSHGQAPARRAWHRGSRAGRDPRRAVWQRIADRRRGGPLSAWPISCTAGMGGGTAGISRGCDRRRGRPCGRAGRRAGRSRGIRSPEGAQRHAWRDPRAAILRRRCRNRPCNHHLREPPLSQMRPICAASLISSGQNAPRGAEP